MIEDYWDKELSLLDLVEKYNYLPNNVRNFSKILNSLKISRRSLSKSQNIAILQHKNLTPENFINNQYKHGWHIDWEDKKHFYRSSYELDYYKILDEQKISYETEKLRILYWDSQKIKQRIAIPDVYIQSQNLIIEIKSSYTYNKQNMQDRVKSFKEHGYDFKLILDHKEIEINYYLKSGQDGNVLVC